MLLLREVLIRCICRNLKLMSINRRVWSTLSTLRNSTVSRTCIARMLESKPKRYVHTHTHTQQLLVQQCPQLKLYSSLIKIGCMYTYTIIVIYCSIHKLKLNSRSSYLLYKLLVNNDKHLCGDGGCGDICGHLV